MSWCFLTLIYPRKVKKEKLYFSVSHRQFPFTNRPQPRRGSLGTKHELTIYIKLNSPETYAHTCYRCSKKFDFDPVTQRQLLIMSNNALAVRKSTASERQSNGMRTHTRHIQTLGAERISIHAILVRSGVDGEQRVCGFDGAHSHAYSQAGRVCAY
jgi:hypothetical protein